MKDSRSTTKDGIVNIHPTRRTHKIAYMDEFYTDSFRCGHSELLSAFFITTRNGRFFEYTSKERTAVVLPNVYMSSA